MKHLFLLIGLLSGQSALAATYYLAANGDDARTPAQAQNPATPWQSLARLNAAMPLLLPGDQVLLRRGDLFRGQLVITRSGTSGAPLIFGAYGAGGAAPVLSGSLPLSGWTSAGPNLWEAPCPAGAAVSGLYTATGKALPLGRYPNPSAANKGYLTIASHTGNTGLTAPALSGNWTGATAVVRSIRWVLDRAPVTAQTGATLTLGTFENPYYTSGGLPNGWGFFLQNHPATLDQNGEWYYYPARGVLRLYAASAPTNGALEATTAAPAGVVVRNQQYLTLENLTIAHTPHLALEGVNVSHLAVRGVQVLGADENGVLLSGAGTDILFENNLIRNVNNNAVNVGGYTDFIFRNNNLRSNGVVAGRGLSGDGQYFAFDLTDGDRATIEGNTLDSCGYGGLAYYRVSNISIVRNVVSNFCLVKDDGGGIYTYNGGSAPLNNVNARILNNTVLNGVGAPEGTNDPATVPAFGIYLDDCTRNTTVQANTVAMCSSGGIFLHGNSNVTATGNTCFNNGSQLRIETAGACGSTGLSIQNNVLVSTRLDALVADYHVPSAALGQLGTLSGNYYAEPFSDVLRIRYEYQNYLLSEWQALARQDVGSVDGPVRYHSHRVQNFIGSERITNGSFTTGISDWGAWASSGARPITWDNANALGSGGSLRLASPTPSPTGAGGVLAQSFIGPVVQAHSYLVRFSARTSAGPKLLEIYLEQGSAPFADLSPSRRVVALSPTAQVYEVSLPATGNDANALITFQGAEDSRPVWLDNVTVREATLIPASRADSVRFDYNATALPSTVVLPAGARYVDVRNAPYSGSFVLAPYTSVVLFRVNANRPTATRAPASPAVMLWPNPVTNAATLDLRALPVGDYQVSLLDATGRPLRRYTLAGGSTHSLSLTDLPAGVFMLQGQGSGSFVLRLLKE